MDSKILKKYGGKIVKYKDLPEHYQMSITWYMACDGGAWEIDTYIKNKKHLKMLLPKFIKKYGTCRFGMVEFPKEVLIENIMKLEAITFKDFDTYCKWYDKHCSIPKHKKTNRWPCILDSCEEEIYNTVLEDGWHRFHQYVRRDKTIPCIYYVDKSYKR